MVAALSGLLLLTQCQPQDSRLIVAERDALLTRVDSLETALAEQVYQAGLLAQVSHYLDSIEHQRQWIRIELNEGLAEDEFILRMKRIQLFLNQAEHTITRLEANEVQYTSQLSRMKSQLDRSNDQVDLLHLAVADLRTTSEQAANELTIKEGQLQQAIGYLQEAETERQTLEDASKEWRIDAMLATSELEFAKGRSLEMAARRIVFAPQRKETVLREALAHYNESFRLGYGPAKEGVNRVLIKLER